MSRRRWATDNLAMTTPGWWKGLEAKPQKPSDPHDHGRIGMRRLHHECLACFGRKLDWMAKAPHGSHIARAAAMLANDYGVAKHSRLIEREGFALKGPLADAGLSGEEKES